jgi:hypothetical protein
MPAHDFSGVFHFARASFSRINFSRDNKARKKEGIGSIFSVDFVWESDSCCLGWG